MTIDKLDKDDEQTSKDTRVIERLINCTTKEEAELLYTTLVLENPNKKVSMYKARFMWRVCVEYEHEEKPLDPNKHKTSLMLKKYKEEQKKKKEEEEKKRNQKGGSRWFRQS